MNIVLLTKSKFKEKELRKSLKGYGFNIFTYPYSEKLYVKKAEEILDELNIKNSYFIREETCLLRDGDEIVNTLEHLDTLIHKSHLLVFYCDKGINFTIKEYEAKVKGFIDLNKRQYDSSNIYDWDDIFVCLKNMKTYFEMKDSFYNKFSARQIVLSDFLSDMVFFDKKVDLKFNPFNQGNVVEFDSKIYDFINNNKYLSYYKKSNILNPLMNNLLKSGIFTRSSVNKKQRNYWYPSLNAGLPLVPKKDEIHEVTFMFHDLMHHLIPDLIMDGSFDSDSKEAYVIYRMMSESFTIVLADMIFIDLLAKDNINYDWNKRKIYPVYKDMNIENLTLEKLKEILWANVNFALMGNYELLNKLSSKESLSSYYQKYEPFFIEDYRWTMNNFDNMAKNKHNIKSWYKFNENLFDKESTLEYFTLKTKKCSNYSDKVRIIFEEIFSRFSDLINSNIEIVNYEKSTSEAFKRYMLGQSLIFFNYNNFRESEVFSKLIKDYIENKDILFKADINKIRTFFNLYLSKMNYNNVLSKNDESTYKEIVPFFDAFYVFYEKKLSYSSIKFLVDENFN